MESARQALVLIDIQNESQFGIQNIEHVIANSKKIITTCRSRGIPIIYTRHINRSDGVGLSQGEELDAAGKPVFYCSGTEAVNIVEDIVPQAEDIVIDKYRWSAFHQTSLDLFLRSMGVEELLVGGLVSDGCLMTSLIDGYYRDYRIHLIKDICATTCDGGHIASILIMANWVYGIKIYSTEEMLKRLNGDGYYVWESKQAAPFRFTPENMRAMYAKLDSDAVFKGRKES
jgi:nicotinamidase-related amidase